MKRILTALVLVPIGVYAALFAPWWAFAAMVALVACLCFVEYAKITQTFAPFGIAAGLLILLAPPRETVLILILAALAALCLPLAADNIDRAVVRAGALMLGVLYIFGAWKTAILLHDINRPMLQPIGAGSRWVLFGLSVNWIGDTGAYYVGRRFGKHKLAPLVSPGKTWEGAAASAVSGVVMGLFYIHWAIPGTSFLVAGLVALAANVAGQVGDLAESALKRSAGVKDSGNLLPGHGGILDRLDGTMFAFPVLYTLVMLIQP